jgi:hypothetical protein
MQKHRISTNIGKDQKVIVELNNSFDLLEILSLKFTQTEAYSSMCSDYGVVCGRIFVNNGFGVPNARVSIFIPITEEDSNDPVISSLYPFTTINDKNEEGYRYNLLPSRKQHGGHEPTGTFPDQVDILTREEVLEVYEKYYKYTVKTNDAGDFMIWGVPVGTQTIHVDVDLSDMGCFSLRPDDFIRQGLGVDKFKNSFSYKSSNDLDSLPQIVSFNQTIEVYPFWGNEDLCEIGITRTDFDLSSRGVKVEPKSYLLGSIYSDQGKNTVNRNCRPRSSMGRKCDLTTFAADVEILRFTPFKDSNGRPVLERYEFQEDIDEDGSFVIPLPMNMDYVFTNEFGENEITNDPNKGIPTSSCYRFRISGKNQTLGRVRYVGSYLVPNIREYSNDEDGSYAFSLNWNDYPSQATTSSVIFNQIYGSYFPEDYFYRFTYNKVYTLSSYMGSHFKGGKDNYVGIKDISPKEEDDCESNVVTPPINYSWRKFSFGILLAIIINAFERVIYKAFIGAVQVIILPFQLIFQYARIGPWDILGWTFYWAPFESWDRTIIEPLQRLGMVYLSTVTYPECESCDEITIDETNIVPSIDPSSLYNKVGEGVAVRDKLTLDINCDTFDFSLPSSGTTEYNYRDCGTNELITLTIPFSGSPVNGVCLRSGSLSLVSGDNTATNVGTCNQTVTETFICDFDPTEREYFLSESPYSGLTSYFSGGTFPQELSEIITNIDNDPLRQYYIRITSYLPHGDAKTEDFNLLTGLTTGNSYNLIYRTYSGSTCGVTTGIVGRDLSIQNSWLVWNNPSISKDYVWTGFTYEVYDNFYPTSGTTSDGFNSGALPEGCLSMNTIYDDTGIVKETYCATGVTANYDDISEVIGVVGTNCTSLNLIPVGQVAWNENINPCGSCGNRSGFSEFRFGVYSIIPSASRSNWDVQFKLITEYSRRKLVNKLFCEGVANYSFIDNWLAGSLYMFPFKARVRWDNEEILDLNFRGTKYCDNLLYYKVKEKNSGSPVKRFYYRSTRFNNGNFEKVTVGESNYALRHPTTIMDLGPRDEFIKEICVDQSLDPNCSVVRNIGQTSFQSFKEMLGLYINYRLDTNADFGYKDFFQNNGFNNPGNILNGDLLQLISINSEVGIDEFDLQNRYYGQYNPTILDPDDYSEYFKSQSGTTNGPLPINFVLDDEGYRVRVCLNEPGRLTESSQLVPFFYWDKKGEGFGEGYGQSWDYGTVITQRLQGMTHNYLFTGDTSYNYVLFPMTKTYSGDTFTIGGVDINDGSFDIEDTTDVHTNYDNQEEGFTVLFITSGDELNPLTGILYTRVGSVGNWVSKSWNSDIDFITKPTENNYSGNKQILSTPFLFYFGLRPGKTAVDKFIKLFGPKDAFTSAE